MNNISQIMKQAKVMQEKMAEMQKKIEETEIEGVSGGGAVKVLINGKHVLKKITIDPNIVDKNEVEVLEDLILAAMNDATKKISENMSNQMNSISGGLGLPPGMKLPFNSIMSALGDLIELFSKLPNLGPRSARRIVLYLLKNKEKIIPQVITSLNDLKSSLTFCENCGNVDISSSCSICNSNKRKSEKSLCS